MSVPNWYSLILLALAAYRTWWLLSEDTILDKPRRYVTRLGSKWKKEGDTIPKDYRERLAKFIDCPYCLGAWCALVWWGAWQAWGHRSLVAATPFALSALLVAAERLISRSS